MKFTKKGIVELGLVVFIILIFTFLSAGLANFINQGDGTKVLEAQFSMSERSVVQNLRAQLIYPTLSTTPALTKVQINRPSPKIFLMGGHNDVIFPWTDKNNVIASSDGLIWSEILKHAPWSPRSYHSSVLFNNQIWIMGGLNINFSGVGSYREFNDVWKSSNGMSWTQVIKNAPWTKRLSSTSLVFGNKIYLIGGSHFEPPAGPRVYFNDVWKSEDGVNWSTSTEHAPWTARHAHTSVVFNNKMWVIGGAIEGDPPGYYYPQNDIWSSVDGVNWIQETEHAPWPPRSLHTSVVFNNKMWVIGGDYNDVWSSTDGINWVQATSKAAWPLRWGHVSFVFNDKMWVVGGFNYYFPVNTVYTDAWSSVDGITWTQETVSIPDLYGDRPTTVVF